MRIRIFEKHDDYMRRYDNWERVFCLLPILVDGELIWLEYLERKLESLWSESYYIYRKCE